MSTVSSADPMPIPDLARGARFRAMALNRLVCVVAAIAVLMLTAPAAGASPLLQSTGSSFAGVAIQQWVGQSATLYGLNINWQVSSSVIGLNNFGQNQVDFAASDIPYSAQQSTYYPSQPYQYMPDVAGGLSFMFNLNGTDGQQITNLNLNTSLIGQIFLGKITNWNSSAIAAANPQLAGDLPNQKIIPVYRSDASGENYLLSDYLLQMDGSEFQAAQTAFNSGNPGQPTATWPVPAQGSNPSPTVYPGWGQGNLVGQSGSDNAANYVAAVSSLGSITYVETAYAKEHAFPVASLINASGAPVQPTSLNVSTALEKAILHADLTQNLSGVYTDPVANAYPLSAYSYLVTPCSPQLAAAQGTSCASFTAAGVPQPGPTSPLDPQKGKEIGQFVDFLACAGQQKMAQLGYSPLPPNLVQEDFDAIGRLNGAKEPPPRLGCRLRESLRQGHDPEPRRAHDRRPDRWRSESRWADHRRRYGTWSRFDRQRVDGRRGQRVHGRRGQWVHGRRGHWCGCRQRRAHRGRKSSRVRHRQRQARARVDRGDGPVQVPEDRRALVCRPIPGVAQPARLLRWGAPPRRHRIRSSPRRDEEEAKAWRSRAGAGYGAGGMNAPGRAGVRPHGRAT